ncbi:hypothetical protein CAI21_18795 [Alkalilimnicola ehrlichii]|uniref:N-acetyltransferase domain-containing protein n=1 Tax=Alkalilimnicola ehrlichii TaxID=351052 RepID=A0A3E0WKG0_9GAMM|nr:GNAT family N-acetyltransferase [Alkalilimnicola ehrlichii]RFA25575.1 hypothetical protein CAI21_18795 [Alkalilimnicola ehrlichii]RFA32703.1 hypothetical protein CAL65_19055 [Alkalilimnicola ehrlichii]
MTRLKHIRTAAELASLTPAPELAGWDANALEHHRPDAHWVLFDRNTVLARCSLWWRTVPPLPDERPGVIGHYGAADAESGRTLLEHVCNALADQGCTVAIGPMDGNTWRSFRFVSERGDETPFFMEPWHPPEWPRHWQAAGFDTLARYRSGLNPDLTHADPHLPALDAKLTAAGYRLRTLRLDDFDTELGRIHRLSLSSFRDNFLYDAMPAEDFLALYRPLRARINPELVLLAERDDELCGFVFALPDLLRSQQDTVIVKTLAVHPEQGGNGLGGWLTAKVQQRAGELGYRRAVHALMVDANRSRRISERYGEPMRRYVLLCRRLTS